MQSKKYALIHALLMLCIFFTVEAGGNPFIPIHTRFTTLISKAHVALTKFMHPITNLFTQQSTINIDTPVAHISLNNPVKQQSFQMPGSIHFRAIVAAAKRALTKISQPLVSNTWSIFQARPKTTIFSIFSAAVAGIFLHSAQNHHHDTQAHAAEELQQTRQELQETHQQIAQAQQVIATTAEREAFQHIECDTLRQNIDRLKLLYEAARQDNRLNQNSLRDTLIKVIQTIATEKSRYEREADKIAEQRKEWLDEKNRYEERYTLLKSQLESSSYNEQIAPTEEDKAPIPNQATKTNLIAFPPIILGTPNANPAGSLTNMVDTKPEQKASAIMRQNTPADPMATHSIDEVKR